MNFTAIPEFDAAFIAKFNSGHIKEDNGCWTWLGRKNDGGYGRVRKNRTQYFAHRVAYTISHGPITDGLVIDHLCRNRGCVNPAHLEMVTQQVNVIRGAITVRTSVDECVEGHAITGDNVMVERRGRVRCRECYRNYMREYMRKRARAKKAA